MGIEAAGMANITKYNRIKAELAEAGKKNQELAEFLGMHITTVSDWCTNKNQPSVQDLFRIAEFLRIDVRRLLHETIWEQGLSMVAEPPVKYKNQQKKSNKRIN